jgi:hypothetical protein
VRECFEVSVCVWDEVRTESQINTNAKDPKETSYNATHPVPVTFFSMSSSLSIKETRINERADKKKQ